MGFTTGLKNLTIAAGAYGPARRFYRRLRSSQQRLFDEQVEQYRKLIPAGSLCFDVGANIGEKSEAMLRAGASRVLAFEPNPQVTPELRARCGGFPGFSMVQAAVGSESAVAPFYANVEHTSSSMAAGLEGQARTLYVPVVTLSGAMRAFGVPYYCKIDVEGWELEVLRGLGQPIPLLSFEFHLNDADIAKTRACLEILLKMGATEVNVTPDEAIQFHLDRWVPADEFLRWFPGDLSSTLPGYPYGNLFVRSATQARSE